MRLPAAALALALLASSSALADPRPDYMVRGEAAQAASRHVQHGRVYPFAALNETGSIGRSWSAISFYAPGQGQDRFIVRKAWGNLSGAHGVAWADTRTCPALASVLAEMRGLAPRPMVPGLDPDDWKPPLTDGTQYVFWSRRVVGETGDLAMTGDDTSPLARWWRKASRDLDACWSEQEPA